jgi:hypothetical protein
MEATLCMSHHKNIKEGEGGRNFLSSQFPAWKFHSSSGIESDNEKDVVGSCSHHLM